MEIEDIPLYGQNRQRSSEIDNLLLSCKIDTTKNIERAPTILSIKERGASQFVNKRLFTLGNFSCLIGKAKSRKTFLLSLLTAGVIRSDNKFYSEIPAGKTTILYFDTEQGEYDSLNVIKRIEYMTGNKDIIKAFMLREYTPSQRCDILERAFELWGDITALCVIDGAADLATAINDEEEATRVTSMFLRLTKVHNCHIATVLHQNKNDGYATGWIGSQIMKKAEAIISVTKKEGGISLVNCDLSRGIDFAPFEITINQSGIPIVCDGKTELQDFEYPINDQQKDNCPF